MSAHFSPIIMVVMHGLTAIKSGIADPSAARSRASSGAGPGEHRHSGYR
ncbi:hypothetical protein ACGFYV_01900 [Streptomyces sp. NPDC048297]